MAQGNGLVWHIYSFLTHFRLFRVSRAFTWIETLVKPNLVNMYELVYLELSYQKAHIFMLN